MTCFARFIQAVTINYDYVNMNNAERDLIASADKEPMV